MKMISHYYIIIIIITIITIIQLLLLLQLLLLFTINNNYYYYITSNEVLIVLLYLLLYSDYCYWFLEKFNDGHKMVGFTNGLNIYFVDQFLQTYIQFLLQYPITYSCALYL